MKLHHRTIGNLTAGSHSDGAGLRLKADGKGGGTWSVRYSANGKKREKGLGTFPAISLKQAREAAQDTRHAARRGIDTTQRGNVNSAPPPLSSSPTLGELGRSFLAVHLPGLRPESRQRYRRLVELHILTPLGHKDVSTLNLLDLHALYSPRLERQFKLTKNTLEALSTLLAFGRKNGAPCSELLTRDYRTERIYRTALSNYKVRCKMGEHSLASLPFDAWPACYMAIPEDNLTDLAAKFVILTAARRGTAMKLRCEQVQDGNLLAHADQMKANMPHLFPLGTEACRIVNLALRLQDGSGLLFGQLGKAALIRAIRKADKGGNVHGIRHAIATWADRTGVADTLADEVLSHISETSTRQQFYVRDHDVAPLRAVYNQWADHLTRPKVTRLRVA